MSQDPLGAFRNLAGLARAETPLRLNVADKVLDALGAEPPPAPAWDFDWLLFAAGSLVAAGVAGVVLTSALFDQSPLALCQPFVTVLQ